MAAERMHNDTIASRPRSPAPPRVRVEVLRLACELQRDRFINHAERRRLQYLATDVTEFAVSGAFDATVSGDAQANNRTRSRKTHGPQTQEAAASPAASSSPGRRLGAATPREVVTAREPPEFFTNDSP